MTKKTRLRVYLKEDLLKDAEAYNIDLDAAAEAGIEAAIVRRRHEIVAAQEDACKGR